MRHLVLLVTFLLTQIVPSAFAQTSSVSSLRMGEAISPAAAFALEQSIMFLPLDGSFHAEGQVSRLEFTLATLNRVYAADDIENCYRDIAPSQPVSYLRLFSDVERDTWFGKKLCVGMRVGLIQGHNDGSFRPFASITAAEASKILAKAYGLAYGSPARDAWYVAAMRALQDRGAVAANANPNRFLNREEMARMFYVLRATAPLAMTPALQSPMPVSEGETAMPGTPRAPSPMQIAPVGMIPPMSQAQSSDCGVRIGAGSPGAALLVLGQEAHPRRIAYHSRRMLRKQVEEAYQNGTFVSRGRKTASVLSPQCDGIGARSPGTGILVQGIYAKPDRVIRPPNRVVRAMAEGRTFTGGVQLQ